MPKFKVRVTEITDYILTAPDKDSLFGKWVPSDSDLANSEEVRPVLTEWSVTELDEVTK